MNDQGITYADTKGLKLIGVLRNEWRQRNVGIYENPKDTTGQTVVSVGHPMGGGEPIVCIEPRTYYLREIAAYPREIVYR